MRKFECAYTGALHQYEGTACQDSVYSKRIPGGRILSLCDGAGSCLEAAIGSREMARSICLYAADNFHALWTMDAGQLSACIERQIQDTLIQTVRRYGGVAMDYGSTLLCVAYRTDTGEYLAIQLGDGVIAARTKDRFEPVFLPSPLPGMQSHLTTSSPRVIRANLKLKSGFASELMLVTDGGKNILYDDSGMINPIVETIASLLTGGCGTLSEAVRHLIVDVYRPFDDFSMGLLCSEAPKQACRIPGKMPLRRIGNPGWNHRKIHQDARQKKAVSHYISSNDAGKTLNVSLRKANWGRRSRKRQKLRMQEQFIF